MLRLVFIISVSIDTGHFVGAFSFRPFVTPLEDHSPRTQPDEEDDGVAAGEGKHSLEKISHLHIQIVRGSSRVANHHVISCPNPNNKKYYCRKKA